MNSSFAPLGVAEQAPRPESAAWARCLRLRTQLISHGLLLRNVHQKAATAADMSQ
jgi:hypothetical protein